VFGAASDDCRDLTPLVSLLRATLESTADGILVVDREGRIVTSNRQFAVMWRIPPEILASRDDEKAIAFVLDQLRDPEPFLSKVRELYAIPEAESFDVLEFKDGRTFERYSRPQWVEGRAEGRVWSFRDVTEHRRLQQELLQSQKLEAVGRLAGGIAHDFNNLLTTILGYSELLLRGRPDDAELQEDVGEIRKASERAASLTRQLLAFSRKQVIEPRVLDLNALVGESIRMLRPLIGEDIELSTVLAPNLPSVRADPVQIEQVIVNLAVNARDAMPGGGKILLETAVRRIDAGSARPGGLAAGDFVTLRVTDTGSGMDEATQERIFEPFFTTKEKGKGTGLGLSTAYGIVKQSGGDIRVRSARQAGSTFEILLPALREKATENPPTPPPSSAPRVQATVLLAEDEDGVRALNGRVLEARGYRVLTAPNAAEALALIERQTAPPDLLVTDVVMPGASGRELARRLRERHPGIRILFVSGYAEDAPLEDEEGFLQKPFTPERLGDKVAEILAGGARSSSGGRR
jgi:PAS domain S-box-containing protein